MVSQKMNDTEIKLLTLLNSYGDVIELDWHFARLKHCGEKKIAGIRFKKDSPYYDLCSDIEITPRAGQVLPHAHKLK